MIIQTSNYSSLKKAKNQKKVGLVGKIKKNK